MQEGPKRLSWGRTSSKRSSQGGTSRPGSGAGPLLPQQQYIQAIYAGIQCHEQEDATQQQLAGSLSTDLQPAMDSWQQLPSQAVLQLQGSVANDTNGQPNAVWAHQPSSHVTPDQEQQIRRSVLRAVLAGVLQADGPQLDHYQLTVQAVAAVALHKITEAANRSREEVRGACAFEYRQQLAAAQSEADQKLSKLMEEANSKAAVAAAQHRQEIASLQSQLSAQQREKRQLHGRTAQHSRDAKQATAAVEELQLVLEQTRQQLYKVNKQLEAKETALVRSRQTHQQELAALQTSLAQVTADAASNTQQYDLEIRQIKQQHSQQLAGLDSSIQQKLQAAHQTHQQELHQQEQQHCVTVRAVMQELHVHLGHLQEQQHEMLQSLNEQCTLANAPSLQGQLEGLKSDFAGMQGLIQQAMAVAGHQQTALQALQQQVAAVAPAGLEALQQQLESARLEQQTSLQQLQEASLQLATLQPVQARLQHDKQALQEKLEAAQAAAVSQQQQSEDLRLQVQEQEQQMHKLQVQLEASKGQLVAAEAAVQQLQASLASTAQDANERHSQQQQEAQALQQQIATFTQQQTQSLKQLQEHLQWLNSTYLASSTAVTQKQQPSDSSPPTLTAAVLDAVTSGSVPSAASLQLRSILGNDPALLEARYQQFVQHKEQLLQGGPDQAEIVTEVQQQTLQLEAGLLQLMLCLQDVLQAVDQQQAQLPAGFNSHSSPTRPATASSRLSEVSYAVSSTAGRAGHSDLTTQLLHALAKDKRQLTQRVKKLQSQQSLQRSHQANKLNGLWGLSSSPDTPQAKAELLLLSADTLNVADTRNVLSAADDVDEVLMLLQDCQLTNTRSVSSSGASSHAGDACWQSHQQQTSPGKPQVQTQLKHSSSFSITPVAADTDTHRLKKSSSTNSARSPGRGIASLRSAVRKS